MEAVRKRVEEDMRVGLWMIRSRLEIFLSTPSLSTDTHALWRRAVAYGNLLFLPPVPSQAFR